MGRIAQMVERLLCTGIKVSNNDFLQDEERQQETGLEISVTSAGSIAIKNDLPQKRYETGF